MRRLAGAVLLLLVPGLAHAQDRAGQLRDVERRIEQEQRRAEDIARERERAAEELGRLQADAREAAAATMERERQASDIEAHLGELEAERAAREARIASRRVEIGHLAGALQRLAHQPPEALALEPGTPLDAARTGNLLATLVGQLEREARALRGELDALAAARTGALRARAALADALSRLAMERDRLDAAVGQRADLVARLESEGSTTSRRIERLGREAADLRDLLGRLDRPAAAPAVAPARAPQRQASVPPGERETLAGYRWPAAGRVVEAWGQSLAGGQTARGILLEPRETASVVAPFDGTVAFAGPFRGYGQILILEHPGGYHSILAQLSRIDAVVGQSVTAGEPVGRAGNDERGTPTLYIELRRHGQPVDPSPWLTAAENGARR